MRAEARLVPLMKPEEVSLLRQTATGKQCAIEYGAGGSTLLLLDAGVQQIVSVESDPAWIQRVVSDPAVAPHVTSGRLRLLHADIGPTQRWGRPVNEESDADWPRYWMLPWENVAPDLVDFVLIDGRFRIACGVQSLMLCAPNCLFAVHDFWSRRHYQVLLYYMTCVARAETLAILQPKSNLDPEILEAEMIAHLKSIG